MKLDLEVAYQNVLKAIFDDDKKDRPGDRRGGNGVPGPGGSGPGRTPGTVGADACVCPSGAVKKAGGKK